MAIIAMVFLIMTFPVVTRILIILMDTLMLLKDAVHLMDIFAIYQCHHACLDRLF